MRSYYGSGIINTRHLRQRWTILQRELFCSIFWPDAYRPAWAHGKLPSSLRVTSVCPLTLVEPSSDLFCFYLHYHNFKWTCDTRINRTIWETSGSGYNCVCGHVRLMTDFNFLPIRFNKQFPENREAIKNCFFSVASFSSSLVVCQRRAAYRIRVV